MVIMTAEIVMQMERDQTLSQAADAFGNVAIF